jgi:hypothetical protein
MRIKSVSRPGAHGHTDIAPPGTVLRLRELYGRARRFAPLAFFMGGFAWDSLTLTRIDSILDNLILFGYLFALWALVALSNIASSRIASGAEPEASGFLPRVLQRSEPWFPMGIQFFLGGLFSAYVVFYFHSASLTKSSLFLAILISLLVANEFLEGRLGNVYLQTALCFLASYSFLIFFIPVVTAVMNYYTFLAAGALSFAAMCVFLWVLARKRVFTGRMRPALILGQSAVLLAVLNLFYLMNWIPPVPLSVKHMGIYHSVAREGGKYVLGYERPRWYEPFRDSDDPFMYSEGDRVYCFVSVFAPSELRKGIMHVWQRRGPDGEWADTDRLAYDVTGGRGEGYRGYTFKRNVSPGLWRVRVMTEDGLLLGQETFSVLPAAGRVDIVTGRI